MNGQQVDEAYNVRGRWIAGLEEWPAGHYVIEAWAAQRRYRQQVQKH